MAKPAKGKAKNGKATARNVDTAKRDQFGFRLGTKKAAAAALYASKRGATLAEVKEAVKSTQFNLLTELEKKGFKINKTPTSGEKERKVTNYRIVTP
jgi:hypothetical protein